MEKLFSFWKYWVNRASRDLCSAVQIEISNEISRTFCGQILVSQRGRLGNSGHVATVYFGTSIYWLWGTFLQLGQGAGSSLPS